MLNISIIIALFSTGGGQVSGAVAVRLPEGESGRHTRGGRVRVRQPVHGAPQVLQENEGWLVDCGGGGGQGG